MKEAIEEEEEEEKEEKKEKKEVKWSGDPAPKTAQLCQMSTAPLGGSRDRPGGGGGEGGRARDRPGSGTKDRQLDQLR